MARYIDADALKLDIDLSKGAIVLDMALSVIKAVKEAPAADVVPKSEYDAVVSAVDNSTKEFLKLHDKYQDIKREFENYKSIAETQQKLSMDRYFEIKQLKQELDKAKGKVEYLQSELDVCEMILDIPKLEQEIETLKDTNEHLTVMLAEAKAEVAREIFAEIEENALDLNFAIGSFDELKKKYTEEKG